MMDELTDELALTKCDCCGSTGGFHMEGCPRHCRSEILVFSNATEMALGTLKEMLPWDWDVRYVRDEGGHWDNCEGMTMKAFAKKYKRHEVYSLLANSELSSEYFRDLLGQYLVFHLPYAENTTLTDW